MLGEETSLVMQAEVTALMSADDEVLWNCVRLFASVDVHTGEPGGKFSCQQTHYPKPTFNLPSLPESGVYAPETTRFVISPHHGCALRTKEEEWLYLRVSSSSKPGGVHSVFSRGDFEMFEVVEGK